MYNGNPMVEGMAIGTANKRAKQLKAAKKTNANINEMNANLKGRVADLTEGFEVLERLLEEQKGHTKKWRNAHDEVVKERDRALAKRDQAVVERDRAVAERDQALAERDQARRGREKYFSEIEAMSQQARELAAERDTLISLVRDIAPQAGYAPDLLQSIFNDRHWYYREQNSAIETWEYVPEWSVCCRK